MCIDLSIVDDKRMIRIIENRDTNRAYIHVSRFEGSPIRATYESDNEFRKGAAEKTWAIGICASHRGVSAIGRDSIIEIDISHGGGATALLLGLPSRI